MRVAFWSKGDSRSSLIEALLETSRVMGSEEYVERRRRVIDARDRGDSDYLIAALVDPAVRTLAATALGELRAVEATDQLVRLLAATDPHVRASASAALGRIGSETALPELRDLAAHDDEAFVRTWATVALADSNDRESVDLVASLLHDRSRRVRAAAAMALGRLGDARAIESLRSARPTMLRSPFDWYAHRRVYDEVIRELSRTA